MAARTQRLCQVVVDEYGGDAAAVWRGAATGRSWWSGWGRCRGSADRRRRSSPRCWASSSDFQPPGWRQAAGPYGEAGVHRSVADVTDEASLAKVRDYKKQAKAAARAGRR